MGKSELTQKSKMFTQLLLNWFGENRRKFPWRETSNPYKVLIAEILLRKTNAEKVSSVYEHFLRKYPRIEAIVNADLRGLEKSLRTLGLYRRRAKELKGLAQMI